ncbi:MAG: lipocalin family protein [Adhaeribacter sp.]
MKIKSIHHAFTLICLTLLLLASSCKEKTSVGSSSDISGNESKTWKTDKETTATGDKDKLSSEEKKQEIQFFANGSFSMRSPSQNSSGKWTYDTMARTLTLQFVGSDNTETFQVTNLTKDKMTLVAADNSKMELEAE